MSIAGRSRKHRHRGIWSRDQERCISNLKHCDNFPNRNNFHHYQFLRPHHTNICQELFIHNWYCLGQKNWIHQSLPALLWRPEPQTPSMATEAQGKLHSLLQPGRPKGNSSFSCKAQATLFQLCQTRQPPQVLRPCFLQYSNVRNWEW